jgi:hypothetical protein
LKLWDLRRVREVILSTETPGVEAAEIDGLGREKEEIMRKIEITWEQDLANVHKLLAAVTTAEDKFYAFARYYQRLLGEPDAAGDAAAANDTPQSGGGGKRLPPVPHPERKASLGNNKELGRVFNYLIRIRKLQKELDDVIAPPGGSAEGGYGDSDSSGDELSLDEVASGSVGGAGVSSPTTSLSPVTSSDSLSTYAGSPAPAPAPAPRPSTPQALSSSQAVYSSDRTRTPHTRTVVPPPRPSSLTSGTPIQPPGRPGSPSPSAPGGPPPPRPSRPPSFPPGADDGGPPPLPPTPSGGIPPFTGPVPVSPRGPTGGRGGGSVRLVRPAPSRSPSVSATNPPAVPPPLGSRPSTSSS